MTISVFIVEDSPIALQVLTNIITSAPDLKIAGTATNSKEALAEIPKVKPDVICTDFYMKGMDGLELIQQVMAHFPRPILVISVAVGVGNEQNVFSLLQAGAIDVLPKPQTGLMEDYNCKEIVEKIRILAGVKVFTRPLRPSITTVNQPPANFPPRTSTSPVQIVALGASTGGPQAVYKICRLLAKDFPVPILCTQHISPGFLPDLVSWMDRECALKVKIAEHGEELAPATVYYAPDGCNLEVDRRHRIYLSPPDQNEVHCPSVNVMFRSIAWHYGSSSLAVLLTGMGEDGAKGLESIFLAGGITIAQNENSCVVFGMPKAAIDLGVVQHVLGIEQIGAFIRAQCVDLI